MLAMVIDVEGHTGNGVQLLNAQTGAIRSLDAGDTALHGSRVARQGRRPRRDCAAGPTARSPTRATRSSRGAALGRRRRSWRTISRPTTTFPKELRVAELSRAAVVGGRQHDLLRSRAARAEGGRRASRARRARRRRACRSGTAKDLAPVPPAGSAVGAGSAAHDARRRGTSARTTIVAPVRRSVRDGADRPRTARRARDPTRIRTCAK